jgi:S1-C subfamily serine protease
LRSSNGVIVVARVEHTPRLEADLKIGDVICSLNGKKISHVEELRAASDGLSLAAPVVLEIERDGTHRFVAFELE